MCCRSEHSKCLLISWLQAPPAVMLDPKKIKYSIVHGVTKSWTRLSNFHFHSVQMKSGRDNLPGHSSLDILTNLYHRGFKGTCLWWVSLELLIFPHVPVHTSQSIQNILKGWQNMDIWFICTEWKWKLLSRVQKGEVDFSRSLAGSVVNPGFLSLVQCSVWHPAAAYLLQVLSKVWENRNQDLRIY